MLGCFNPNLGQIWTNPNVGLKITFKNFNFSRFFDYILTQHLGLSIFDPNLGWNNPASILEYEILMTILVAYTIFYYSNAL